MIKFSFSGMPTGFSMDGDTAAMVARIVSTLMTENQTIASGACNFSGGLVSMPEVAVTVKSNQGLVFRSGNIRNKIQSENAYLVQKADTLVFTLADISGMLPSVPQTTGNTTLSTISVSLQNGFVRASGTGSHKVLFANVPFNYTYDFEIKPETSAFNVSKIIDIDTRNINVTGNVSGLLGFITNAIIGIIASFFENDMAEQIEDSIQQAVDNAIAAQLSAETPPAGTTVTVERVVINSSGISIFPFGGISVEDLCASNATSGSIKLRPAAQVNQLKLIRDQLLAGNPHGKAYMDMFYKHNRELMKLLIKSPDLLKLADKAVAGALKDFKQGQVKKGQLSKSTADAVSKAIELIKKMECSKELKNTVIALNNDVKTFTGVVAADLLKRGLKDIPK